MPAAPASLNPAPEGGQGMAWADMLAGFDRVRFATPDDNERILSFFAQAHMNVGGLALRYDRTPDFFAHLRHQGRKFFVLLFLNDDGSVGGVASLSLNPVFVEGRIQWAGYLSDLRTSPEMSRGTRGQWRGLLAFFLQHLHALVATEPCRYAYLAILDANRDALRALGGSRSDLRLRPLVHYEAVNLLARIPLLWRAGLGEPGRRFRVRGATPEDLPRLRTFLGRQSQGHLFGFAFGEGAVDELDRRLAQWDGFRLDAFLLAEERETGRLVGCLNPWQPRTGRRLVVERLPWFLRLLGVVLPVFGKPGIREGSAVDLLYLTCLEVETRLEPRARRGILALMVAELYDQGLDRQAHLVSFFAFRPLDLGGGLHGYLAQRTPATLYQALHRDRLEGGLDLVALPEEEVPGFEPGLA